MPSPGCVSPDSPWFSSWLRAASMSEEQPGPAPCGSAAARCLLGGGGGEVGTSCNLAGPGTRVGMGASPLGGPWEGKQGEQPTPRLGLHPGGRKSTFQVWGGGRGRDGNWIFLPTQRKPVKTPPHLPAPTTAEKASQQDQGAF